MPSTRLDDLVSEFYPKIKKKAFALLSKLVEIKVRFILTVAAMKKFKIRILLCICLRLVYSHYISGKQ